MIEVEDYFLNNFFLNFIPKKSSAIFKSIVNVREPRLVFNFGGNSSSIYFNSHISNEDLEEFAIHECLHFLQEIKDDNNHLKRMGLSIYSKSKSIGTGLN